jgi:two-component system sensor histidine kinase UhpB
VSSLPIETWYILFLISLTFIIFAISFVINLIYSNRRLKRERDFSSSIVDTNPALIITFDSKKRVVHFNIACELISGYNCDEIIGRYFKDVPILREEVLISPKTALNNPEEKFSNYFESHWISNNGKKCTVAWSTTEFENPIGGVKWILSGIDITEQKKAEEALHKSHEQLQNLSAYLQTVREEERTKIARDIHDELGQLLSTLLLDIGWLEKQISRGNKDKEVQKLKSMSKITESAIGEVQKITSELRPSLLDNLGLIPAIEWFAKDIEKKVGIRFTISIKIKNVKLNKEVTTAIYRIIQESLTNVIRHAKASEVKINLQKTRKSLILEISDDGIGIKKEEISAPNSFGLVGIRERARSINGELEILGIPKKGTTIKVSINLDQNSR